jgi:hypothetical protein
MAEVADPNASRGAAVTPLATPTAGRTRVVLAEVARGRRASTELAEQSPVGDALLRGLVRTQLAHALKFAAVVTLGLGGLPVVFALVPSVAQDRPLGVSLPWLLLGVAAFPFLYGVGALYVRIAERTEKEFTDLVERPER